MGASCSSRSCSRCALLGGLDRKLLGYLKEALRILGGFTIGERGKSSR